MLRPQVLRGMRDFLPEQMILRQRITGILRDIFERHGFEPIETPVLEYIETLTGNLDDEKLMYHFTDHGGRQIGMRFDLTVPFARFVALHQNELTFPFKRYHIAPVYRAERPQRGRFREFWQCDADIVGSRSMLADADVISIFVEGLSAVNIPQAAVHINHRQLLEAVAEAAGVESEQAVNVYRSIDKFDKIGHDGVREELISSGLSEKVADAVLDYTMLTGNAHELVAELRERLQESEKADAALDDLSNLFSYLDALGIQPENYRFDMTLARGLAYYTGPVFEARTAALNVGSLGGAGRYDGLVGRFSKQDLPATGISFGLERIIEVVQEFGLLESQRSIAQVLVTVFDEEHAGVALNVTKELRAAGINTETYLDPGRNLGRQFRYADQKGIPYAIVVGPDEAARGVVAVKDLASGGQSDVARTDLAQHLRKLLAR